MKPAPDENPAAAMRRIAEAHGGTAYVRNREGGGAVVGLELPRGPVRTPA